MKCKQQALYSFSKNSPRIIRKDKSRGIREILENKWLKSDRDKKRIDSKSICCQ